MGRCDVCDDFAQQLSESPVTLCAMRAARVACMKIYIARASTIRSAVPWVLLSSHKV